MSHFEPSAEVWECERLLRKACPCTWAELDRTPEADVRHCRQCDKDVYQCKTPQDYFAHGAQARCVAIPDHLSPRADSLRLGETSAEEVLLRKALVDRGLAWWEDVARREPPLDAGQIEAMRSHRAVLEKSGSAYSPKHLAFAQLAVRDGGVRCPHCGEDIDYGEFEVMIYLATGRCFVCQQPFDLPEPAQDAV
jgi:hypothetical protein